MAAPEVEDVALAVLLQKPANGVRIVLRPVAPPVVPPPRLLQGPAVVRIKANLAVVVPPPFVQRRPRPAELLRHLIRERSLPRPHRADEDDGRKQHQPSGRGDLTA